MAAGFGSNYNRSIFFFALLAFAAVFTSSMVVSGEDSRRSLKVDVNDYTNPLPNPAHEPKIPPSSPKDAMRSEKVDVTGYIDPQPHPGTHWNTPPPSTTKVTVRSQVGLVEGATPDRAVLIDAWKSWMEEHIAATGKVPSGNEKGNTTFVCQPPQKKPNLRLTPGRHVQLTIPLENLIDQLVKEKEVVAFIKGSRSAPLCGFSQRVVGILESHGVDFECVDVLDEEYNPGLRETLKTYSNWPTFPQVFVKGELLGGCDIITAMAEKGELATLFKK